MTHARGQCRPWRSRAGWVGWLIAMLWLGGARTTTAQPSPAPAAQHPAGEEAGAAGPRQRERAAKAAFQAGVEAAEAGDYARARELFLRSRVLVVKASTLLNLAVADLKLGLADEALAALDALDAESPEPERLRERARELRAEAERMRQHEADDAPADAAANVKEPEAPAPQTATVAAIPDAPAVAPPPALGPPRALLIAGGALAASAVGGALWWSDRSRAVDACHNDGQQCREHSEIERQERAAMALTLSLGTVGLGLLTGGAVWFAQRKHDQRARTDVSAWIGRSSGGATLRSRF